MTPKRILLVLPWLAAIIFATLYFSKSTPNFLQPTPTPITTPANPTPIPFKENLVLVTRVVDGDTIEIEDGTRVRYIGIDTPERDQCFGSQATEANKALVAGKKVRLETDIQKIDKYQRTLAYMWVGDTMVNEELVVQGSAKVYTFPPNVKYVDRFVKAQKKARENQLGLWAPGVCSTSNTSSLPNSPNPPDNPNQIQGASSDCPIKGNISSSGERIYHMPGQRYYEKTKIEESQGERFFCSEEEATEAGWRKSKI